MSQALLAIQNILQNSDIFNRFQETVLSVPFDDKKVTQFSGFLPNSVSYLKARFPFSHFKIFVNEKQSHNVAT